MRALLLTLTTCLFVVSTVHAKYSGGTGEPNDPYQIATAADLIALGETPEDYDKHFILTADIDLDPNLPGRKVFDKAVFPALPYIYDPILDILETVDEAYFDGSLDGRGHTISHLTVSGSAGLFRALGYRADIQNLGILDVAATDSNGPLTELNCGYVADCYSTGKVTHIRGSGGGLVGSNHGTMIRCHSSCEVHGDTGAIEGDQRIGGLVGSNTGIISNCYSSLGTVSGSCGESSGVGGLVGWNEHGNVSDCYSTGAVSGSCGESGGVGGLVGRNFDGDVVGCFWDILTSGQAASAGGTGLPTPEMQMIQTYLDAGWDLLGEVKNGLGDVWQMPQGGAYPVLAALLELHGRGTPDDPYLISNAAELGAMVRYDCSAHYRLTTAIDLSGVSLKTPVIPSFAGTFDGNDRMILNLTVKGEGGLGLFGHLSLGAEVKDLAVLNVNITGSGGMIGGLAGSNGGTVNRCYGTGVISGTARVGGLLGYNDRTGVVLSCHAYGSISGLSQVAGLVGDNSGAIVDCSFGGNVDASSRAGWSVGHVSDAGGIVGRNEGSIRKCSSTSSVSGDGNNVGGLVGANVWGEIRECEATGVVISAVNPSGGLVGYNDGPVHDCSAEGTVMGNGDVGGLVGINASQKGKITNCYAGGGLVNGNVKVGGLVGRNWGGAISRSYSYGRVSGEHSVGGLVGWGDGPVAASFWDVVRSNQTTSAGGTGKTTTEMQTATTFLDAGWDFVDETANGTEDIWWILEGKDYPRLW
jgi:hypothetical protein